MIVPSLNLDGSLSKKRSTMKELDGVQPGFYSPRPSANKVLAPATSVDSSGHRHLDPDIDLDAPRTAISDPDLDRFPHSTTNSVKEERSPSGSLRRPAAIETLIDHQQARESSPSIPRLSRDVLGGSVKEYTGITPPGKDSRAGSISGVQRCVLPTSIDKFKLNETYVMGVPLKQYLESSSTVHPVSKGKVFRQNPIEYVSAMTTSGNYVALGDRTGRVTVMCKKPLTSSQKKAVQAIQNKEADSDAMSPRTSDSYEYLVSQFAYTSVIDPLNNVEVTPNISALSFLPQNSRVPFLLTANEKVPKLYKILPSVRESVEPFKMVDQLEASSVGPLTNPSRTSTVAMKMVSRYALNHEYNINSLCPLPDSEQFVSADDLTMQLWCTEYPDVSLETYSIRPPGDDDAKEMIRVVRSFPHEPFLLFVVTSAGNVRVIDTRQNLKWLSQSPQIFSNPIRPEDGAYSHVTNSLGDCALSPCGRYIAGRDFMTACLWDVRNGTGGSPRGVSCKFSDGTTEANTFQPLQRWELHPHLREDMETFYQSDLLFERFDVAFLNKNYICTGGFGNTIHTIDIQKPTSAPQQVQLPPLDSLSSPPKQVLKWNTTGPSSLSSPVKTEIGSRVTLLTRPQASYGGTCEFFASSGQALTQLNYTTK